MTTTQKVLTVLVFLVLVAGAFFLARKLHAPAVGDIASSTPPVVTAPSVAPFVTEATSTAFMTMKLSYPKSSKTEYPEIFNFVQKAKTEFISQFGNMTEAQARFEGLLPGEQYEFDMRTEISTSSKTVSYIINLYEYTGGAHGGTSVSTFTYNATGTLVTLSDVFSEPYLKRVSGIARAYLYKTLNDNVVDEMITAGTEPTKDNFSTWYLTDSQVVFVFGQYQVGPYVLGIIKLPLAKETIADILSPAFK